jgi:hypothetical protein
MANMAATVDTAYLGQYFYKEFGAVGGIPPYTWEHVSGQFPYGTTFDPNDPPNLSGYPNYASDFCFQMRVYDSSDPALADTASFYVTVMADETYTCGDVNDDEIINVSDAVFIINYIFLGGDPPDPLESGDCNCDNKTNITDAVWIITYVFSGGRQPCDTDGNGLPDC